ncbi:MAG: NAD(P)/FAD-dependent oxidoreductase [Thermoplasmata archaeon]
MKYEVVIVGSGPAGMFAAYELSLCNIGVLVVEKGKDIDDRKESDIMSGVGGAGAFSDGTVNLRPDVGGNLIDYTDNEEEAWDLVDQVSQILSKHGMPPPRTDDSDKEEKLKKRAASVGARFYPIPQAHIGSDRAPTLIKKLKKTLESRGVDFMVETGVNDIVINEDTCAGVKLTGDRTIQADKTIIAPGRVGTDWVQSFVARNKLMAEFAPIDIGVRVEVPSIIMDDVIEVNRDPKFHLYTKSYDDFIRTFCTNHRGYVVKESYDGFIGVNGHSRRDIESENTNFAFLVRTHLTEPLEDTTRYGLAIAQLASTIGGGDPIVQRMGDLRSGRRSTQQRLDRNPVQGTLKDVTPGDISMSLPHRTVVDIIEGLNKLDKIIPGVNSNNTLLYAPEIKFYAKRLKVDSKLQTSITNLHAAGDGAGLSHDIVNAAATGILAARGILKDF